MQHLIRQFDLIPEKILDEKITIIGAGAIGGWTTLSLAKMGFHNLTVYDFDVVSVENMNSQFYRFTDIGKSKVSALKELVENFTNVKINSVNEKYEGKEKLTGIVISSVDSMRARKAIWDSQISGLPTTKCLIDPRMGAESAALYVMNPAITQDRLAYKASLYTDSEAIAEPCTAKATIYTANLLAGLVVKSVKDFLTNPDSYLRVVQWNIRENDYVSFNKGA